jgi:hypothetical protein
MIFQKTIVALDRLNKAIEFCMTENLYDDMRRPGTIEVREIDICAGWHARNFDFVRQPMPGVQQEHYNLSKERIRRTLICRSI